MLVVNADRARAGGYDLKQAAGHDQVLDEMERLVGITDADLGTSGDLPGLARCKPSGRTIFHRRPDNHLSVLRPIIQSRRLMVNRIRYRIAGTPEP
jgi:hypothetical protein